MAMGMAEEVVRLQARNEAEAEAAAEMEMEMETVVAEGKARLLARQEEAGVVVVVAGIREAVGVEETREEEAVTEQGQMKTLAEQRPLTSPYRLVWR